MIIVESKHGLPLTEAIFPAKRHDASAVEPTIEQGLFHFHKPKHLLGDKAFSSKPLTSRLKKRWGIVLTAPPKRHYVHFFHDGRTLRRKKRRWKVERCFAWLKTYKRIEVRWDVDPNNYLGFVQIAAIMILLKYLF